MSRLDKEREREREGEKLVKFRIVDCYLQDQANFLVP